MSNELVSLTDRIMSPSNTGYCLVVSSVIKSKRKEWYNLSFYSQLRVTLHWKHVGRLKQCVFTFYSLWVRVHILQHPGEPVFLKCCRKHICTLKKRANLTNDNILINPGFSQTRPLPCLSSCIGPDSTKHNGWKKNHLFVSPGGKIKLCETYWFLTICRRFDQQKCSEQQTQHDLRGQHRRTDAR